MIKFIASILIAFMLHQCEEPVMSIKLSEEDHGQQYEVSIGAEIFISLKANPTTGYTWTIATIDTTKVKQLGEIEFKPESKLLGAPGKQILRFQSIATGTTHLILLYLRPWEKGTAAQDTFEIAFKIVK